MTQEITIYPSQLVFYTDLEIYNKMEKDLRRWLEERSFPFGMSDRPKQSDVLPS